MARSAALKKGTRPAEEGYASASSCEMVRVSVMEALKCESDALGKCPREGRMSALGVKRKVMLMLGFSRPPDLTIFLIEWTARDR